MAITVDSLIASMKASIRDEAQEKRIRQLYERSQSAFQSARKQGVKQVIDSDWNSVKTKFTTAMSAVKKDTGLF